MFSIILISLTAASAFFLRRAKQGDEIYRNWQISGSLSKNEKSLHTDIWIYYGYCSKNIRFQTPNQQIFGRKRPFSSFFLSAEEEFSKCDRLISLFCSSFSSPSWTFPKVPALPRSGFCQPLKFDPSSSGYEKTPGN